MGEVLTVRDAYQAREWAVLIRKCSGSVFEIHYREAETKLLDPRSFRRLMEGL